MFLATLVCNLLLEIMTYCKTLVTGKVRQFETKKNMALVPYRGQSLVDLDVWPRWKRCTRVWYTHPSNLFISAVENIERTGRILDDEDKKYLRWILTWYSGWSATPLTHFDDEGFQFLRYSYADLQLEPILDDITFPEEVAWLPDRDQIGEPCFILLASPTRYYIYVLDGELFDAGATLKEVYEGLRDTEVIYPSMEGSGWRLVELQNPSIRLEFMNFSPKYDRGVLVRPVDYFYPDLSDSDDDDDDDNDNDEDEYKSP
jgi:hypothetical protein